MIAVRPVTKDEIEFASRSLIRARETNLGWEVEMPVLYPTGKCVSVVVTVAGGDYIVHDAGFGTMHLTSAGVSLTQGLKEKLVRIAEYYGCSFMSGRMSMSCNAGELAVAIALVANASKAVGDQLMSRRKPIRDFRKEVASVIEDNFEAERKLDRKKVIGESGTTYEVNFVLLDRERQQPLAYIEPIGDSDSVNGKFREFFDIKQNSNHRSVNLISVYDDRSDWRAEDIIILAKVSNVVAYNDLPTRLHRLAA
jgi:hypothetical protein